MIKPQFCTDIPKVGSARDLKILQEATPGSTYDLFQFDYQRKTVMA
jgi:hypothetical protein